MRSRSHLGTSFEVWKGQHTWFWFVADPRCNSAAIGAAANEAEAIREARSSIEEMSVRGRVSTAALPAIGKTTAGPVFQECNLASLAAIVWNDSLANLARYLNRVCGEIRELR